MKQDIHPTYHLAKVTCSCGNTFEVGATVAEMRVEICSNCHPFYTGTQKFIDTAGRLERFQERLTKAQANKKSKKSDTTEKAEKAETNKDKLKALKKSLMENA